MKIENVLHVNFLHWAEEEGQDTHISSLWDWMLEEFSSHPFAQCMLEDNTKREMAGDSRGVSWTWQKCRCISVWRERRDRSHRRAICRKFDFTDSSVHGKNILIFCVCFFSCHMLIIAMTMILARLRKCIYYHMILGQTLIQIPRSPTCLLTVELPCQNTGFFYQALQNFSLLQREVSFLISGGGSEDWHLLTSVGAFLTVLFLAWLLNPSLEHASTRALPYRSLRKGNFWSAQVSP